MDEYTLQDIKSAVRTENEGCALEAEEFESPDGPLVTAEAIIMKEMIAAALRARLVADDL